MKKQHEEERKSAEMLFHMANNWYQEGNIDRAIKGYQEALQLKPSYWQASLQLGDLLFQQGRIRETLAHYENTVRWNPENIEVRYLHGHLNDVLAKKTMKQPGRRYLFPSTHADNILKDQPDGKLNLYNQIINDSHRSGWQLALSALTPLHNSQGILFDGFVEYNFGLRHWQMGIRSSDVLERLKKEGLFDEFATSEEKGITPYTQPWVGVFHHPSEIPPVWEHYRTAPQIIVTKDIWKESLEYCVGLFTLSEYHAQWLNELTGKPVSSLIYPTENPEIHFDFLKFMDNPHKKIIQLGCWLRRFNAIYQLPIPKGNPLNYEKIRILPYQRYLERFIEKERTIYHITIPSSFSANTREINHLFGLEYDNLLAENIIFVYLYDAIANNIVVECIARATPLLINPLPAVVEYLGKDYPMYFRTLAEAAQKALDTSLIYDTHQYLKTWEVRNKITAEYFLNSVKNSAVYQLI